MQDLTDLYQSVILDQTAARGNRGKLPTANRVAHGDNPSCGDQCTVYLRVDGDRISDIRSRLRLRHLAGQRVADDPQPEGQDRPEAEAIYADSISFVTTGNVDEDNLSDLAALAGVHQFPPASSAPRSAGTPP